MNSSAFSTVAQSIFSPIKKVGHGCFGTSETRFGPYDNKKFTIPQCYETVPQRNSALRYSFGVSRDQMQKQFIDQTIDTIKKGESTPAPDTYQKDVEQFLTGSKISHRFKKGQGEKERALGRAAKLPGPCSYNRDWSISPTKNYDSKYRNQPSPKLGKQKRFHDLQGIGQVPAPGAYDPRVGFSQSVIFERGLTSKFGKSIDDILIKEYGLQESKTKPGPGSYEVFSEFQ